MDAADCEALAKMLSGGSRLRVLNLCGNKLEDQGLIHLSSALENCRLEEIKYSCTLLHITSLLFRSGNVAMKAIQYVNGCLLLLLQSGWVLTDSGIHVCTVFSSEQWFFRAEDAKPEPELTDG